MAGIAIEATEWIERLIGFDTVSANPNMPLVEDVANYLDGFNIPAKLIPDDTGSKANLFATIGADTDFAEGIVLSGHTDVVPVAGQPWDSDPFQMMEMNGRIYGRGSADMKGFIGCVLAMIPELAARNLSMPVHLALSYDEEVGCIGIRHLIGLIGTELPRPKLVIVGEPTGMNVFDAHKGISQQSTTVTGLDAHSSRPGEGVNAVAFAAEIIGFISRLALEYAAATHDDGRFDPPGTTFNIGTIEGGTAVNIIARECTFKWEFRPTPGTDPQAILKRVEAYIDSEILPRMHAVDRNASVRTTVNVTAPTLESDSESLAVQFVLRLAGANQTGAASYVCEAGLFAEAGIPAVICGPGNIAQAHKPNEFVDLRQINACSNFLSNLMDNLSN
ncbi:MAG: acetylornithine deacetylase [Pseudomonadota bacterium]|nr:acetylornithine deacetylase [Pseudomonadota bacterium]